jgi:hypothetical protein
MDIILAVLIIMESLIQDDYLRPGRKQEDILMM